MDEEVLIGFGILLLVAVPLTVIGLAIWAVRQSRRMRALEGLLTSLEAQVQSLRAADGAPPETVGDRHPKTSSERPERLDSDTRPDPETESPPESQTAAGPEALSEPASAPAGAAPGPWEPTWKRRQAALSAVPPSRKAAPPDPSPPRAVVFRRDRMAALVQWLQINWIYVVSAASLATAGIFLVQYGIENGYLTPRARIWAALAFGAGLVGAGEYLRRRWGDESDVATAFLPSVFSSAGIVTLFAAILAARHLYQLIGSGPALVGLGTVALLAVVLGWFSGPLLAAVGLVGAIAAPFAVGGQSDAPEVFYVYFGVVTVAGLLIDTLRRWAWVSVLSLVLGFGAAWLLYLGIGAGAWLMGLCAALALAAIAVPVQSLAPAHAGTAIVQTLRRKRPAAWPDFPTNLAAGTLLVAVAGIALVSLEGVADFWLSAGLLLGLFAALSVWCWRAHALEDLAALPALALVALPVLQAIEGGAVLRAFRDWQRLTPEDAVPHDPILLAAAALGVSLLAAHRSFMGARWPVAWAAGAAVTAPLMMLGLEIHWRPAMAIGPYPWALTAAAIAMAMGLLAERFARADGAPGIRTALATLAALLMICFALVIMLTETALTLALAATLLAAAALDRRFNLPPLIWFIQADAIVIGWRLVIDPGLAWADAAPYPELFAAYAGVVALLLAARAVLRTRNRAEARVITESAAATIAAVFASVLIYRVIGDLASSLSRETYWAISLTGMVWILCAANAIWRLQIGGPLKWLRRVLGALYLVVGAAFLLAAVTILNPLLGIGGDVLGPVVLNTLLVAYILPALVFAFMAWRFTHLSRRWRVVLVVAASAFAALWLGLAIRHLWRGSDLSVAGTTQPELYSYTLAMLLVGAGLLYQAIASASSALRRVAISVVAVTVAKVFLIDASGLAGLIRVFSFLALGLSLAGLAFVNRWAAGQEAKPSESPAPQ